jgi:hypothetical protein
MILEILLVFLFLCITSSGIYLTGKLILSIFNYRSDNLNLFHALIAGLLFWVLVPSLILTKVLTIHLFFIPLIFLFFLAIKKEIQLKYFDWNWKQVLLDVSKILIFITPIFLFAVIQFYDFKSEFIYADLHHDFHAYAKHSQYLILTGNENYFREANYFFNQKMSGVTPYHYFELWLNGVISWGFKISTLKGIMLITFPLLQTIAAIGIFELIKKHTQIQKYNFFLALIFLMALIFIQPIYFWFYDHYELLKYHQGMVNSSVFSFGRKYGAIFIFSILALDFFIDAKQKMGIISLSALSILSIGILPGMTFGIPVGCLGLYFWKRKNFELLKWSFLPFILGIMILLFYKIFTVEETKNLIQGHSLISSILTEGLSILYIKTFLFSSSFPLLRLMIGVTVYVLIILFVNRFSKSNKKNELIIIIIITSSVLFMASCASAMANGLPDSGQLFINTTPLLNALLIIIFIILLRNYEKKIQIIAILTIITGYNVTNNLIYNKLMNSYQTQSSPLIPPKFKTDVCEYLIKVQNPIIGVVYKNDILLPHFDFYTSPSLFLDFSDENPICVNLSSPDRYIIDSITKSFRIYHPLFLYSEQKKDLTSFEQKQKFVLDYKVNYILSDHIIKDTIFSNFQPIIFSSENKFIFYKRK